MRLPSQGLIFDLGCGYGPLGIVAAKTNPALQVIMADTNTAALKLAKLNATMNGLSKIDIRRGSLYAPVGDLKFDLILSNPPLSAGFGVVSEVIQGAASHLKGGHAIEVVVRKGFAMVERECSEVFGNVEVLARGSGYRAFHTEFTKT